MMYIYMYMFSSYYSKAIHRSCMLLGRRRGGAARAGCVCHCQWLAVKAASLLWVLHLLAYFTVVLDDGSWLLV